MNAETLNALQKRISRLEQTARVVAGPGYEQTHQISDGTTHHYAVTGLKSPEQFEDEMLALFVWVWSLKDYVKEAFKARGVDPQIVEHAANNSPALQLVSDVANRAKHGILRKSRSGGFAELVDVGYTIPQSAIGSITVGAFNVALDVANAEKVELHAAIRTQDGTIVDAFETIAQAMLVLERQVIKHIEASD